MPATASLFTRGDLKILEAQYPARSLGLLRFAADVAARTGFPRLGSAWGWAGWKRSRFSSPSMRFASWSPNHTAPTAKDLHHLRELVGRHCTVLGLVFGQHRAPYSCKPAGR